MTHERGVTAIEIVVGVALVSTIITFSAQAMGQFLKTGREVADKTQALYLAEDALELARLVRDEDWTDINAVNDNGTTDYAFSYAAPDVTMSAGTEAIGAFTRSVRFLPLERNGNDDIVTSGTEDDDGKIVTALVTWSGGTKSVSLSTILANVHE